MLRICEPADELCENNTARDKQTEHTKLFYVSKSSQGSGFLL